MPQASETNTAWLLKSEPYHDNTNIYGLYRTRTDAEAAATLLGGPDWADLGYEVEAMEIRVAPLPATGEYCVTTYWPSHSGATIQPRIGGPQWVTTRTPPPSPSYDRTVYFQGYGATVEEAKANAITEALKHQPTDYKWMTSSNNSTGTPLSYWQRPCQ
jgi:hypothetical protein